MLFRSRVDALCRAVRDVTTNRQARQVVGAQSAPVGVPDVEILDVEMSKTEAFVDSEPVARPITAEDLVAVITGVQAQQPPPSPPPPPPAPMVRTAASIVTNFVQISLPTFLGEGDPILAEKLEEQIVKHLDALKI